MFLPPDVQMLKLSNRLIAKLLQLVLKGFIYLFLWHPELPPHTPILPFLFDFLPSRLYWAESCFLKAQTSDYAHGIDLCVVFPSFLTSSQLYLTDEDEKQTTSACFPWSTNRLFGGIRLRLVSLATPVYYFARMQIISMCYRILLLFFRDEIGFTGGSKISLLD